MRFGSVTIADNDEGAAMIDYMGDKDVQEKCFGRMMLEVPVSRVVHAQDSALVAKRIHSVQTTTIRSSVAPDGKPFVPVDSWDDSAKTTTDQGLVPSEVKPVPRKDRPGRSHQAEAGVGSELVKRQRQKAAQSLEAQAEVFQKKQRRIYASSLASQISAFSACELTIILQVEVCVLFHPRIITLRATANTRWWAQGLQQLATRRLQTPQCQIRSCTS
jgi:hypothetical protein